MILGEASMYGKLWKLILIQNIFLFRVLESIGSRKPISDGEPIVPGSQPWVNTAG